MTTSRTQPSTRETKIGARDEQAGSDEGATPVTAVARGSSAVEPGQARGPRVRAGVGGPEAGRRDVRVDLGRGQARVAQQLLDDPQVGAAVEQVRGERVAQGVRVRRPPAGRPARRRHRADSRRPRSPSVPPCAFRKTASGAEPGRACGQQRGPAVREVAGERLARRAARAARPAPCGPCRGRGARPGPGRGSRGVRPASSPIRSPAAYAVSTIAPSRRASARRSASRRAAVAAGRAPGRGVPRCLRIVARRGDDRSTSSIARTGGRRRGRRGVASAAQGSRVGEARPARPAVERADRGQALGDGRARTAVAELGEICAQDRPGAAPASRLQPPRARRGRPPRGPVRPLGVRRRVAGRQAGEEPLERRLGRPRAAQSAPGAGRGAARPVPAGRRRAGPARWPRREGALPVPRCPRTTRSAGRTTAAPAAGPRQRRRIGRAARRATSPARHDAAGSGTVPRTCRQMPPPRRAGRPGPGRRRGRRRPARARS